MYGLSMRQEKFNGRSADSGWWRLRVAALTAPSPHLGALGALGAYRAVRASPPSSQYPGVPRYTLR